ncbi:serine/threonine protein phosphatase [Stappia sp. F7233]|uniref:Serine/threonine protein phosphatase n=1 Tax=Stappia albiluteola TaxID=2758565 RepID=A0A839AE96_9HYPH|nr:metallophosphoesterase [Stappia albiluteola]MBA5777137.1 serine/threonine protein phosphatase [Stappia albiluteola]
MSRDPNDRGPLLPDGTLVYAIGDMHGMAGLLEDAIAAIAADRERRKADRVIVVTLGDYVDRGPQTSKVLDRLSGNPFGDAEHVALQGNHEQAMLGFIADPMACAYWLRIGGLETLRAYGIRASLPQDDAALFRLAAALARRVPARQRAFLDSLRPSFELGGYFFVHAGIRPGVALEAQNINDLLWIRDPFLETTIPLPKTVVHGHTPVDAVDIREDRINIDTGACFTGLLSVLMLSNEEKGVISVREGLPSVFTGIEDAGERKRDAAPRAIAPVPDRRRRTERSGGWAIPVAVGALAVGLFLTVAGAVRALSAYEALQPVGLTAMTGRAATADGSRRIVFAERLEACRRDYFSGLGKVPFAQSEEAYRACGELIADYNSVAPADPYGWLAAAEFAYEADGVGERPVALLRMAYRTGTAEGSSIANRIVLGFKLDALLDEELRQLRRGDLESAVRYRIDLRALTRDYIAFDRDRELINEEIARLSSDAQDYLVVALDRAVARTRSAQ